MFINFLKVDVDIGIESAEPFDMTEEIKRKAQELRYKSHFLVFRIVNESVETSVVFSEILFSLCLRDRARKRNEEEEKRKEREMEKVLSSFSIFLFDSYCLH